MLSHCFTADVEFPVDEEALDEDAESLIRCLLCKDQNARIGAGGKYYCLLHI